MKNYDLDYEIEDNHRYKYDRFTNEACRGIMNILKLYIGEGYKESTDYDDSATEYLAESMMNKENEESKYDQNNSSSHLMDQKRNGKQNKHLIQNLQVLNFCRIYTLVCKFTNASNFINNSLLFFKKLYL